MNRARGPRCAATPAYPNPPPGSKIGRHPGFDTFRPETTKIDAQQLAATIARLADDKKATAIQLFDIDEHLGVADYFVVITAQNRTHCRALYNELHVRLKAAGQKHRPVEGADLGWWIVLDYGDVVVHLLQEEAREFYDLDQLYHECPTVDWQKLEPARLEPVPAADR